MQKTDSKEVQDVLKEGEIYGIKPTQETLNKAKQWRQAYDDIEKNTRPIGKKSMFTIDPDEQPPKKNDPPLWLIIVTFGIAYLVKLIKQLKKTENKYNKAIFGIKQNCHNNGYDFVDENKTNIKDIVEGIKLYNEIENDNLTPDEKQEKQKKLAEKCKNNKTLNCLIYSDKPVVSTVRGSFHGATMVSRFNAKTGKKEFALIDGGIKENIPVLCGFPSNEYVAKAGIDCFRVDSGRRMCMSVVREMSQTIGEQGLDAFMKDFCICTKEQKKTRNRSEFCELADNVNNVNILKLLNKKTESMSVDKTTNLEKTKSSVYDKKNVINIVNVKNQYPNQGAVQNNTYSSVKKNTSISI